MDKTGHPPWGPEWRKWITQQSSHHFAALSAHVPDVSGVMGLAGRAVCVHTVKTPPPPHTRIPHLSSFCKYPIKGFPSLLAELGQKGSGTGKKGPNISLATNGAGGGVLNPFFVGSQPLIMFSAVTPLTLSSSLRKNLLPLQASNTHPALVKRIWRYVHFCGWISPQAAGHKLLSDIALVGFLYQNEHVGQNRVKNRSLLPLNPFILLPNIHHFGVWELVWCWSRQRPSNLQWSTTKKENSALSTLIAAMAVPKSSSLDNQNPTLQTLSAFSTFNSCWLFWGIASMDWLTLRFRYLGWNFHLSRCTYVS